MEPVQGTVGVVEAVATTHTDGSRNKRKKKLEARELGGGGGGGGGSAGGIIGVSALPTGPADPRGVANASDHYSDGEPMERIPTPPSNLLRTDGMQIRACRTPQDIRVYIYMCVSLFSFPTFSSSSSSLFLRLLDFYRRSFPRPLFKSENHFFQVN